MRFFQSSGMTLVLAYGPERRDELDVQETAITCDPVHILYSSDTVLH